MKRKLWEVVVVILVLALSAGFIWWRYSAVKSTNETALVNQLKALRMGVATYMEVNKHYPPDLKTLVSSKFKFAGGERPYVPGDFKKDKDGNILDSFGKPFNYDPATGKVSPSEPTYKDW